MRPLPRADQITPGTPLRLEVAAIRQFPDDAPISLRTACIYLGDNWTPPALLRELRTFGIERERTAGKLFVTKASLHKLVRLGGRPRAGGSVYFAGFGPYIKIGFTTGATAARIRELNIASPERLTLFASEPGTRATEKRLHRLFKALHLRGEWFRHEGPLAAYIRRLRGRCDG